MRSRHSIFCPTAIEKFKFRYEYDFGDSWEHVLEVEKILPPDPDAHYPRCLAGKRACPPEDVGGIWGYAGFLEAIRDPEHPQHEELLDWIGGGFDPEAFDLEAVNRELARIRRINQSPDSNWEPLRRYNRATSKWRT